jgi:hypothetical protein
MGSPCNEKGRPEAADGKLLAFLRRISVKRYLLLIALAASPLCAEQKPTKPAKVIYQDIGSENRGTAVLPLAGGIAGVPITRSTNIVMIETKTYRVTMVEDARKNFIVLPVNGTVQFYEEKERIIILDSKNKKHKFVVTHAEKIN